MTTEKVRLAIGTMCLVLVVALTCAFFVSPKSTPYVNDDVMKIVEIALQGTPLKQPIMSSDFNFFEQRLAVRNGHDTQARNRLIEAYLLRFKAYGQLSNLENAQMHIAYLLENGQASASLYNAQAALYLAKNDFGKSVEAARQAVAISVGESQKLAKLSLFDALYAYGNYAAAEAILRDETFNRRSFDFLIREARLLEGMGRQEAAKQQMADALWQAQSYAQSPVVVAWCLTTLGNLEGRNDEYEAAVSKYVDALEILPGYPEALEGLAEISLVVDENPKRAGYLYARALENGAESDVYLKLAEIAEYVGDAQAAQNYREQFIKCATKDSERERLFYRPLATLLAEKMNVPDAQQRAIEYARKDLENRPDSQSYDTLAWIIYKTGHLGEAKELAEKAISWGKPDPSVSYHAGVILAEAGEIHRAKKLLKFARDRANNLKPGIRNKLDQTFEAVAAGVSTPAEIRLAALSQ